MSYFKLKCTNLILAGAPPQPPLEELTAGFKGPASREGRGGRTRE